MNPLNRLFAALLFALAPPGALAAPGSPCGVPLPAPGQTVTWDLAGSPYTVCQNLTIPAGGTVLVDPGVVIDIDPSRTLFVAGEMRALGTSTAGISISGTSGARLNVSGHLEADFTTFSVFVVEQASWSTTVLRDCVFTSASNLMLDTPFDAPIVLRLDRCTVDSSSFQVAGQAALRDVTFGGPKLSLTGYTLIDGLTSTGTLELYSDFQTQHLDDASVTGVVGPAVVFRRSDADGGANLYVGPDVTLQGSDYPLQLHGVGLEPGSTLPRTGNVNNTILGPGDNFVYEGFVDWPDVGLPYEVTGRPVMSNIRVHPGVTIRMGSSASFNLRGDDFHTGADLRGLPGAPIRLEPLDPALGWLALSGGFGTFLFEHLEIDGAGVGVSAPQATIYLNESRITGCMEGIAPSGLGLIRARGTRFLGNDAGAVTDMSIVSSTGLDLDGSARPNVFAGNGVAVDHITQNSSTVPAENNWWNDASGPFHAGVNPVGLGDPVDSFVDFTPWRSTLPDLSDAPPVVRIEPPSFLVEAGEKVILQWKTSDDGEVVSQSILLDTKGGGAPDFQLVAALSGNARAYEWTVPDVGFHVGARPVVLRIEAIDDAGNTSFDQVDLQIPEHPVTGTFALTAGAEGPFQPDEQTSLCWSAFGGPGSILRSFILLEGDGHRSRGPQGQGGNWCYTLSVRMPDVSTDMARWAVISDGNGNADEWYFSPPFEIRPSSLLGDVPPTVELLSPAAGQMLPGPGTVPIRWAAGDDELVREIKIQASYDGARTWHTIARDIPGTETSYDWSIPRSTGIPDVRVRVIAVDRRFQNSSDGADVSFQIVPAGPRRRPPHSAATLRP